MVRKGWYVFVGAFALGMVLGCSSNPYRPTLFQRNREQVMGPELGTPVMDGSYMGGAPAGYPTAPNGTIVMPPNYVPPPGQPIQGFPPNAPPQSGPSPTVPQGPPPRVQPNTPTGRTS